MMRREMRYGEKTFASFAKLFEKDIGGKYKEDDEIERQRERERDRVRVKLKRTKSVVFVDSSNFLSEMKPTSCLK